MTARPRIRAFRQTKTQITNLGIALLLTTTSLSGALSALMSPSVSAAPGIAITQSGFNTLTDWQNDRSAPSGDFTLNDDELVLHVDGDNPAPNASNAFYRTEGRNAALPAGTNSIKATLHVATDWENTIGVRAGIWGVTTSPSVYPIIEFSNRNDANDQVAGSPVIRAWDSATGWVNLVSSPAYGTSYVFEIVHDSVDDTFKFYINNSPTPARIVSTNYNNASHGPFSRIIFNNYNAAIPNNDYSVRWTNFSVGQRSVASIGNTHYTSLQAALLAASTGDTIELNESITLGSTLLNINKGVILNGNGHTITTTYTKGTNGVSNAAVQVLADNVTINDLTVRSTHTSPAHGINIYEANNVTLNNIKVFNNAIGVVVNDSLVTINGIESTGSTWGHAINVDRGNATLTITGTNTWDEARFIYVDNVTVGSVIDLLSQYKQVLIPQIKDPTITAAVYTAPDTSVNAVLPITTTDGVGSTAPLAVPATLQSPAATVIIPAGTVISGTGWNGTLTAPDAATVPAASIALPGYTAGNVVAVSVGASGLRLNFSEPVRVTLPGQAGKLAGFIDHTGAFHAIPTQCGADVTTTLTGNIEECWATNGNDLVIWTTHFTTFVAYTQTKDQTPANEQQAPPTNGTTTVTTTGSSVGRTAANNAVSSAVSTVADILGASSGISSDATKKAATTQSPKKTDDTSSKFLGLGWWWLLVIGVAGVAGYYLFVARRVDRA